MRGAFTLIELLVVITIIAVAMGILIPAVTTARESAYRLACLSNMRQIGIALQVYLDENHGWIPSAHIHREPAQAAWGTNSVSWNSHRILGQYLDTPNGGNEYGVDVRIYRCARRNRETSIIQRNGGTRYRVSYAWNSHIGLEFTSMSGWQTRVRNIHRFSRLSETVIMSEKDDSSQFRFFAVNGSPPDLVNQWSPRHMGGCNLLFLDGHARWSPNPSVESLSGTALFHLHSP